MRIASVVLASGARYLGSDFELRPVEFHRVSTKPSLAVIGTGKRVGKTAVSGYLARLLAREGFEPAVVSMGRGGPPHPEVIEGHEMEVGSAYLLVALQRGSHAASDYYETAALSRVTTVGCRRCGGGHPRAGGLRARGGLDGPGGAGAPRGDRGSRDGGRERLSARGPAAGVARGERLLRDRCSEPGHDRGVQALRRRARRRALRLER